MEVNCACAEVLGGWIGAHSASLLQSLLPGLHRGQVQSGCGPRTAGSAVPGTRASSSGSPGCPALQGDSHPVSWS